MRIDPILIAEGVVDVEPSYDNSGVSPTQRRAACPPTFPDSASAVARRLRDHRVKWLSLPPPRRPGGLFGIAVDAVFIWMLFRHEVTDWCY